MSGHTIRHTVAALVLPSLVAAFLLAASSAPAEAASCKGDTCYGKSPSTYGCLSDAKTLGYGTAQAGYHQYWRKYSAKCQAVWGELSINGAYGYAAIEAQSRRKPKGESSYVIARQRAIRFASGFGRTAMVPLTAGTSATSQVCYDTLPNMHSPVQLKCPGFR